MLGVGARKRRHNARAEELLSRLPVEVCRNTQEAVDRRNDHHEDDVKRRRVDFVATNPIKARGHRPRSQKRLPSGSPPRWSADHRGLAHASAAHTHHGRVKTISEGP